MRKAFTLIELMVAVGILAIVLSFAGVIFSSSIDSYRLAVANAEIMQKLRAITEQLDADFTALRKDGEIFVAWVAVDKRSSPPVPEDFKDCDADGFERFDRIMFFTTGDFQSYGRSPAVRGNLARVCYMLATRGGVRPEAQNRPDRVLARTQHILVPPDPDLDDFDPVRMGWYRWNNVYEYDEITMEQWKHIPWALKRDMLTVISDVNVASPTVSPGVRGARMDPAYADSVHMLLCEGVGEFKVQGWYDEQKRWVPEVDPDGDGVSVGRTDFFLGDPSRVPGVLYPWRTASDGSTYGGVSINGLVYSGPMDEANFNRIPGLGRALKFTFTLYDSKGIIKQGRTFTHIVYLDR